MQIYDGYEHDRNISKILHLSGVSSALVGLFLDVDLYVCLLFVFDSFLILLALHSITRIVR